MGKVVVPSVLYLVCERRSCDAMVGVGCVDGPWTELIPVLRPVVAAGWALVLPGRLLSYCPEHAGDALRCRCGSRLRRGVACVQHSRSGESVVWAQGLEPKEVMFIEEVRGVA